MVFFNQLQLLFFLMLKLSQFCWLESLQTRLCDSLTEHHQSLKASCVLAYKDVPSSPGIFPAPDLDKI